ncbi:MAG TPA: hypothetical protein VN843_05750, partial [Anaerolineales bacterium]|nr:hypothetical protein [Anaerolineales bacterium]
MIKWEHEDGTPMTDAEIAEAKRWFARSERLNKYLPLIVSGSMVMVAAATWGLMNLWTHWTTTSTAQRVIVLIL